MKDKQKDIYGNQLSEREEITLTYDGPSFDGKMELNKLTLQLKSTESLIKSLVNELYLQKKLTDEKTKVYLELKRGSFAEIISILFNHPFAISVVGGTVVALINKLLNKKKTDAPINIDEISTNYGVINNFNLIMNPLQNKDDKLVIKLPNQKNEIITYSDKAIIFQSINDLTKEEDSSFEIVEEEFFGNLNSVNVKQEKFGFIQEGSTKIVPARFDNEPEIVEIKRILAERLKIKARATYEKNQLKKLDIIEYEIKTRKTLKEFMK